MKKKLIFCICILLTFIIGVSTVSLSAYTYECDVDITSASVLVANVETDTFVYEKNVDTARYISYLSNLMTFIVAYNNTADISSKITIEQEMLDSIPNPDNSLDVYVGHTLTVEDLLYFIMLTNGNDACYVLADYVTNGDVDKFVELMNQKAKDLGCTKTKFSSVAARNNSTQFSTCSDLYKIVKCALEIPQYREIASASSYLPTGYKKEDLTVKNTNSLLRYKSPYYFKHVKNGKYGADKIAKGNVIAVSKYSDVSYVCIILNSQLLSEHNAFTEARQLLNWAYTKLGNKKIISKSTVLATVTAKSVWGESTIELTAGKDIERTVPATFDLNLMTVEYKPSGKIELPVFKGQNMGAAQVYYNGKLFDEIDLISESSDGVSMLEDLSSFTKSMYDKTIVKAELEHSEEPTEDKTEPSVAKTEKETSAEQAGQ